MDRAVLEQALADQRAYRPKQVWQWAARGAAGLEEMTNSPTALS
jgi:hypothetical protein